MGRGYGRGDKRGDGRDDGRDDWRGDDRVYDNLDVLILWLQGILRHVPIIGSVISWLSPLTPTVPDGRTF